MHLLLVLFFLQHTTSHTTDHFVSLFRGFSNHSLCISTLPLMGRTGRKHTEQPFPHQASRLHQALSHASSRRKPSFSQSRSGAVTNARGAPGTETKQEGFFVSRYRLMAGKGREDQACSRHQLLGESIHEFNRKSQVLVEIQA